MESFIQLTQILSSNLALLAQITMEELTEDGIKKIMVFALVICICGIIASGFQLMAGNMIQALYILLASLLIGGAPVIAKAFFALSGF